METKRNGADGMQPSGKTTVDYNWLIMRLDEIMERHSLRSDNQLAQRMRGGQGRAPSVIRDIRKHRGQPRPDTLAQLAELAGDDDDRGWLEHAGYVSPLRPNAGISAVEGLDPLARDVARMVALYNPCQEAKDLARQMMLDILSWSARRRAGDDASAAGYAGDRENGA